ncbi:MAG: PPC domain-containing protein, partial [Planctomycetaceae bacterium]|nr:PPC domain-containing protein [Planctomycetaceae bacterium]
MLQPLIQRLRHLTAASKRFRQRFRRGSKGSGRCRHGEQLEVRTLLAANQWDSYDLGELLANQSFETPSQLGQISSGTVSGLTLYLAGDVDYYRFTTVASSSAAHGVTLSRGDHTELRTSGFVFGDAELTLWRIESNGYVELDSDSTGTNIFSTSANVSLTDQPPGDYLLRVHDRSGLGVTCNYSLAFNVPTSVVQDVYEPGELQGSPWNLGTITGAAGPFFGSIHAAGNDDYFRFTTVDTGGSGDQVKLVFDDASGNIGLQLQDNGGSVLATANGTSDQEVISLSGRSAGTYRIRVLSNGHTNPLYGLTIQAPEERQPDPDGYEPNNSRNTAALLPFTTGDGLSGQLGQSLHSENDVDWYRFRMTGPGGPDARFGVADT